MDCTGWCWREYNGFSAHTDHIHLDMPNGECPAWAGTFGGCGFGTISGTLDVRATANPWAAGRSEVPDFGGGGGNGTLPAPITVPTGNGRIVRIDAQGLINLGGTPPVLGVSPDGHSTPDGSKYTFSAPGGKIGGVDVYRRRFLVGVFLGSSGPPASRPPNFDCGYMTASTYSPALGNTFCIGDGWSGEVQQRFVAPKGAATLYLAFSVDCPLTIHPVGGMTTAVSGRCRTRSPEPSTGG